MNVIKTKLFTIFMIGIFLVSFLQAPFLQATEFDLTAAQNAVGKRFASKFCEAKEKGFSSESSSEFALNNTYLKFVAFPDDEQYLEDLWTFTSKSIKDNCGEYVDIDELKELEIFFKEEGIIASNRDLYLPLFENN